MLRASLNELIYVFLHVVLNKAVPGGKLLREGHWMGTPISLYSQWREIYASQKEGRGKNLSDLLQITPLG